MVIALLTFELAADSQSASDLLNNARRAAVVDDLLKHHLATQRATVPFGGLPRFRATFAASLYTVGALSYAPTEGLFDVELRRAYTGFSIDAFARVAAEDEQPAFDSPVRPVFWANGGGLAYGLQRPFTIQDPALESFTLDYGDSSGAQYSDERYAIGGRWRSLAAETAFFWSRVVDASTNGQVDLKGLRTRRARLQGRVSVPLGFTGQIRAGLDGAPEDISLHWLVNEVGAPAKRPNDSSSRSSRVPRLSFGYRQSNYGGTGVRSTPQVVGATLEEDFGWLMAQETDDPRKTGLTGQARTQIDFDLSQAVVQVGIGELSGRWRGHLVEVSGKGGISVFTERTLSGPLPGYRVRADVTVPWLLNCGGNKEQSAEEKICMPFTPSALVIAADYRESWAEDLRYVLDYAGAPQTYIYMEIMGGM